MNAIATCGQLVIGGFAGTSLPSDYARALHEGRRGGAIAFKHNVQEGWKQVAALAREVHAASPDGPPLFGIDQEGGRVARLGAPVLEVPPMRSVASWGDLTLAERVARTLSSQIAALGFTIDFAPVLDVNTCARNPVIGDRAFGNDADTCARFGVAWVRGLQSAGILACGKHFPGHGDTSKDSHLDLPVVDVARERIESVELAPFRAATAAGIAALMSAHVVYPAIDPDRPATLSRASCTVLRERIGFRGMLVSDDMEMKAIDDRWPIEESAVQAIAAGCDALLVCWSGDKQDRAAESLAREAERSPAFRARCGEALRRVRAARARVKARPLDNAGIEVALCGAEAAAIASEMVACHARLRR